MDKIKKKRNSLKWSLILYLPFCVIASFIGTFAIGIGTNSLQDWYISSLPEDELFHYYTHADNLFTSKYYIRYLIISGTQYVLIPLWVILCIGTTGAAFYNRELKKPIQILQNASKKISENQLDFKIEYKKQNEFGALCTAFDDMRLALYENNRVLWRSLEERKRLNSAFSHDLRTPLTVLHGYSDFLQKYIPDGRITEEKLMNVLSMMDRQIIRLEHYTQKMNAVQKLEDIVPEYTEISVCTLHKMFEETGNLLCKDKKFTCKMLSQDKEIILTADTEIIMQIYENLVSNAVRYTKDSVFVSLYADEEKFSFSVSDNGNGFKSRESIEKAAEPFFRDEKDSQTHFGLGLYICRIMCKKCGGTMKIRNHESGGAAVEIIFPKQVLNSYQK